MSELLKLDCVTQELSEDSNAWGLLESRHLIHQIQHNPSLKVKHNQAYKMNPKGNPENNPKYKLHNPHSCKQRITTPKW